jgi:hypothetical protein
MAGSVNGFLEKRKGVGPECCDGGIVRCAATMANDKAQMTKEIQISNDKEDLAFGFCHSSFLGHLCFVIGHSRAARPRGIFLKPLPCSP